MTALDHPGIAKVTAALSDAGLVRAAGRVRVLDADVRTAKQAADAVGVGVGAIANSLLFRVSTGGGTSSQAFPLLVLTSGAHRADAATLGRIVAASNGHEPSGITVAMADPEFVRTWTGQVIGGVAPVGHPRPIRTIVDRSLADHPEVWAAAGHPKAVFPTTFHDLVTVTGGTCEPVTAEQAGGATR